MFNVHASKAKNLKLILFFFVFRTYPSPLSNLNNNNPPYLLFTFNVSVGSKKDKLISCCIHGFKQDKIVLERKNVRFRKTI